MGNAGLATGAGEQRIGRLSALIQSPWLWAAIVALGLGGRLRQYLANPSYWYDEAFLARSVYELSFADLIGPLSTRQITPPFFLWLLRACYLGPGPQEWSLRLPAFLSSVAALALMVPLCRRWFRGPAWPWAVGLCALSVHCIHHSFEVKPYATDMLLTVAILFVASGYLRSSETRQGRRAGVALLAAAALAPWLSFPSVIVLTACSAALLVDYRSRQSRLRLAYWLAFNALLLSTSLLIWFVQARHLYYPGLKDEWTTGWEGFPRGYAPLAVLSWTLQAPERVAGYASTGLGIPLATLGVAGLVRGWRRSKEEFVLLAGPPLLAYLAAVLGKYPFADRAIFFLAPCVWLAAVEGLLYLAERLPAGRAWVPLAALGLMAPGLASVAKYCVGVRPKMEYREALAYVHARRRAGDAVWNWCPDLNVVYSEHVYPAWGRAGAGDPGDPSAAARTVLARPLWVVAADDHVREMTDSLRPLPVRQTLCRDFLNVRVLRFDPSR
jgi:4-amino-4-deoxy-L-arabinose transferase-like glycosyltransferase